jgi:TPR repeat protein
MENDASASASSLSPISGAQSYALTDEQRLALAAKAEAGNADSAFRLSLYYTFTFSDAEQAMHWLSMAAKGGHGVAQHNLAYDLYMAGTDLEKAAYWAAEAQKNGNDKAGWLLNEIETEKVVSGWTPLT